MYRLPSHRLLGLVVGTRLVSADYNNLTVGNEAYYGRIGTVPVITGDDNGEGYYGIKFQGISDILFPYYVGTDLNGYPVWEGCSGFCASSFPYGFEHNTTESKHSANITLDGVNAIDVYSFEYGCYAIGPNGTDAQGQKTYGRVPRDCTIQTSATTIKGKKLKHSFQFKARGNPSNLTFGAWPATFRNLSSLSFSAASEKTKKYPYAANLAFDDFAYGYYY